MSENPITIYRKESYLVPADGLSEKSQKRLLDRFKYRFYDENLCKKCDQLPDRHSENCDNCSAFLGIRQTSKTLTSKSGDKYLSLPRGGKDRIISTLSSMGYDSIKIKSMTAKGTPFSSRIQFKGTLKDFQEEAVQAILSHKTGLIKSPPRSGKCVAGSTVVFTNRMGYSKIEDLFTELDLNPNVENVFPVTDLEILTRTGMESISVLYAKKVSHTILITTKKGKTLRGTEVHPILVNRSHHNAVVREEWVQLSDVQVGDSVVCVCPDTHRSYLDEVISTNLLSEDIWVYDVCVPGNHSFIGEGIVCHNTVIGTAFISKVGEKTLILASQTEWLLQFRETFLGSDTQQGFTNAKEHQIKLCKNLKDFETTDICLSTFQKFMSKAGQKLLKQIKNMFTVCVVDEAHGSPALATSRVLAQINSTYRIGLTATPERKKGDFQIATDLFGEVIYESKVARLRPKINYLLTPGKYELGKRGGHAAFTSLVSTLESNRARRDSILKEAIKYAKQGHLVLIPMSRVRSILEWTREINDRMETPGFALPFYGGIDKKQRMDIISKARNFECRILVGNIALLSTGLNIPRASCLFEIGVNNNVAKADQRFSRILTPMEGKPDPVIVFTLDDCELMKKCRQSEYWKVLKPRINPIVDPEIENVLKAWFASAHTKRTFSGYQSLKEGLLE